MNDNSGSVRTDIWLWAVRLFKTRSLAGASCRGSKVRVNGEIVKPSKMLRAGDMLDIQKDKSQITVEVLNVLKKRVSAKEAINFKREISIITEDRVDPIVKPVRGEGRPTKRQRRVMDAFLDQVEKSSRV
ncbi:MAG: RNA-binding S4 domain-containing protein [Verrucomicrobiota bacterium]|nr:RNA-binding S4 domain-containing protein [Verrucomicrobiota bacterium]